MVIAVESFSFKCWAYEASRCRYWNWFAPLRYMWCLCFELHFTLFLCTVSKCLEMYSDWLITNPSHRNTYKPEHPLSTSISCGQMNKRQFLGRHRKIPFNNAQFSVFMFYILLKCVLGLNHLRILDDWILKAVIDCQRFNSIKTPTIVGIP